MCTYTMGKKKNDVRAYNNYLSDFADRFTKTAVHTPFVALAHQQIRYHTQLAKTSFDDGLNLTAEELFHFSSRRFKREENGVRAHRERSFPRLRLKPNVKNSEELSRPNISENACLVR